MKVTADFLTGVMYLNPDRYDIENIADEYDGKGVKADGKQIGTVRETTVTDDGSIQVEFTIDEEHADLLDLDFSPVSTAGDSNE